MKKILYFLHVYMCTYALVHICTCIIIYYHISTGSTFVFADWCRWFFLCQRMLFLVVFCGLVQMVFFCANGCCFLYFSLELVFEHVCLLSLLLDELNPKQHCDDGHVAFQKHRFYEQSPLFEHLVQSSFF